MDRYGGHQSDKTRTHQSQQQHIDGMGQHVLAERRLFEGDLDMLCAQGSVAHQVEHPVAGGGQRMKGRDDRAPVRGVSQVKALVNLAGHVGGGQETTHVLGLQHDGLGADAAQDGRFQFVGQGARRRRLEDKSGRGGCSQTVTEPGVAKIRDRGDIDRDFRQHDEDQKQNEKTVGQSEADAAPGGWLGLGLPLCHRWCRFLPHGAPGRRLITPGDAGG